MKDEIYEIDDKLLLLEEWQKRLGLQDWAIGLRYNCKQEDLDLDEAAGETHWDYILKTGVIYIVSEEVFGKRILEFDFEKTLVHELLHLKFSLFDISKNDYESKVLDLARHGLVDDLARALVMAKRGETERKLAVPKIINRGELNEE